MPKYLSVVAALPVTKMAKMFELLYGNFKGASYWEKLVNKLNSVAPSTSPH